MKFDLNILDIAIVAFGLLTWAFSPLRDRLFVNTFKSPVNRPQLKLVIDEMYEEPLEEHNEMKEAMQVLTRTLEANTGAVQHLTEVIGRIEEEAKRTSKEVAYIRGVIDQSVDRRAKPRI